MKDAISRLPLILAAILLAAATVLLSGRAPEHCGRTCPVNHSLRTARFAPAPTLAPPQKVVVVRIEADKTDLEIEWAED